LPITEAEGSGGIPEIEIKYEKFGEKAWKSLRII
jgi:hypothetical protein